MEPTTRIWILGAPDSEMEAIESLLRECGEVVAHAVCDIGRVRPDSAYHAHRAHVADGDGRVVAPGQMGVEYWVECALSERRPRVADDPYANPEVVVIDHHRPGDPGYGRPPEEFLGASSLGQVIAELARLGRLPESWEVAKCDILPGEFDEGWVGVGLVPMHDVYEPSELTEFATAKDTCWAAARVPEHFVLCAAADHCLAHAYRGRCPGVAPDALMEWRAESRSRSQGRSVQSILNDVRAAHAALQAAESIRLAPGGEEEYAYSWGRYVQRGSVPMTAADMRGTYVPELPEAAARYGYCFVAAVPPSHPGEREKIVCQGGSPDQILAFMDVWAQGEGLTDIYGDPSRGFAGGYKGE